MEEARKLDRLAAEHKRLREEEIEHDALQDIMLEHQQKIPEEDIFIDVCDHSPELTLPIDLITESDCQKVIYQCEACGEQFEDIRPLDESDMA